MENIFLATLFWMRKREAGRGDVIHPKTCIQWDQSQDLDPKLNSSTTQLLCLNLGVMFSQILLRDLPGNLEFPFVQPTYIIHFLPIRPTADPTSLFFLLETEILVLILSYCSQRSSCRCGSTPSIGPGPLLLLSWKKTVLLLSLGHLNSLVKECFISSRTIYK